MSAYEDHISILSFAGINQSAETNLDLKYAVEGHGFDIENGVLKSVHGEILKLIDNVAYEESLQPLATAPNVVVNSIGKLYDGTLAYISDRVSRYSDEDIESIGSAVKYTYYIAILNGRVYTREKNDYEWEMLHSFDDGESLNGVNSTFDWVAYEINYSPPVEIADVGEEIQNGTEYVYFDTEQFKYVNVTYSDGAYTYLGKDGEAHTLEADALVRKPYPYPADCIFITNEQFGLWCIYSVPETFGQLRIAHVNLKDGIKPKCLCVSNERLWISGIEKDGDKLMYSAPNDPFCWEQNNDSPADGAGDILQPNFDGDEFLALKSFGGNILAFKKRKIYRVIGTNPEDLTLREQYGGGAIVEDSIAIHGTSAYFISENGLTVYDGNSSTVIAKGKYRDFIPQFHDFINNYHYRAVFDNDVYCLFHLYDKQDENGAYDGTVTKLTRYNIHTGIITEQIMDSITNAVMLFGNDVVYLCETNRVNEYNMFLVNPTEEHLKQRNAGRKEFKWISAYQDMGQSHVVKSGFIVYMTVNAPVTMTIGIRTEKKLKQKTVTFTPNKPKRIQINNSGRRFRLEMSAEAGAEAFELLGGVQIHLEYDVD